MVNFRNIRDEGIINVANATERLTIATEGTIVCQTSDNTLWLFYNGVWNSLSGGGGGAVTSVSNADGTLTISPTTGAVVASRSAITGDVSVPAASTISALSATGVVAGSYTNANITVDAKGRITLASNGSSSGGVSSITSSDGSISVSAPTGAVDLVLPASGATAGTYPILKATIDSAGRVTAASDNTILTIINALVFG